MNNPLGMVDPDGRCPVSLIKEGDTYVCPLTLDGGEINAISDKTYRERREYLAGGDYMLEGLGKGFLYMVAGGAGIYAGGAYLAGAGIETAATSFLTHKTVIQGAQIATEIMASEAGLVGVGGAAAVGVKQVAKEVVEEAVVVAAKVGMRSLDDLSSLKGATWDEAKSLIPKDWISGPMKKGEGIKFVNPAKKGEQILLEKGWPGAKDPRHAGPYMKISRDGQITRIPLQGNPTLK